jgi:hypothetical protein
MICNYSNAYVDVWVMKEYGLKESLTSCFRFQNPVSLGLLGMLCP